MEQRRFSEAKLFSAKQEFPGILRNPMVHCRFYNSPLLVSILSQINPVQEAIVFLEDHFEYPPIYAYVFLVVSVTQDSPPRPCMHRSSHPIPAVCPPI
jgi:hypothetical protein